MSDFIFPLANSYQKRNQSRKLTEFLIEDGKNAEFFLPSSTICLMAIDTNEDSAFRTFYNSSISFV